MTHDSASGSWRGAVVPLAVVCLLAFALLRLQGGWPEWQDPGFVRGIAAASAVLAYVGLCCGFWWRHRARNAPTAEAADDDALLIVWASQTGFAEQLAAQTADSLRTAGVSVHRMPLARLDAETLARTSRALFVVSTTGEGDAPDGAAVFVRDLLDRPVAASGLHYGVLALGDREYHQFCAFGHRLDAWLRGNGARPWFDLVEVDDGDAGALRHWQHEIGVVAGCGDLPDWQPPRYEAWTLAERRLVNPGSVGGSCFHLVLHPPRGVRPQWRAGDIAEIGPRHAPEAVATWLFETGLEGMSTVRTDEGAASLRDVLARSRLPQVAEVAGLDAQAVAAQLVPLPHREYSIASIPDDGAIHLLVRQFRHADGRFGLGSGWLGMHARLGDTIALRIRTNSNFHVPAPVRPLILIGNGTGIAGLRALLKERVAAGAQRNWLLFGERNRACDYHYRDEIETWQSQGFLARVDLAFSRDPSEGLYVQHRLAAAAEALRDWVRRDAAIYVCGSLEGMAPAVDAVLADALGGEAVQALVEQGRYRRDVY